MKNKKLLAKRIIISTLGTLLLGFGCGITVQANIGTDPFTVFVTALADLYPMFSVGNWSTICCVVLIIVTLFINKKCIGYTTVAFTLFGQFTIDLAIDLIPTQESMVLGIVVFLIGVIVIGISVPMMSSGDMGFCAYDSIIMAISGRLNTTYKKIRYIFDAFFLVVGYLIGGLVGVGTIISVICMGYVIDKGIKLLTPPFKRLVYGIKK